MLIQSLWQQIVAVCWTLTLCAKRHPKYKRHDSQLINTQERLHRPVEPDQLYFRRTNELRSQRTKKKTDLDSAELGQTVNLHII